MVEVVEEQVLSEEEAAERNRKRPSQSSEWRHIGILGSTLDLETGDGNNRDSVAGKKTD